MERRRTMKNSNDPSPAEMKVLKLVAAGNSNKEIADSLGLKVQTVKGEVRSLFLKFRVSNRTALVKVAKRKGLLTEEESTLDKKSTDILKPNIEESIEDLLEQVERNAWKALAGYKFIMFGYWAAIWVYHNKISPRRHSNPFKEIVDLAKEKVKRMD
jgi:DNA-binding CsgD family transcriptional regulator